MANSAQCVKAGDLDGDGDNDVVVGTRLGNHVLLYRNPGDGQFGPPELVMEAGTVYDLELADLDLDGDTDIVVGDFFNGWVSWSENTGSGVFAARAVLIDDIFTTGITALEIGQGDSDPELELFTLNYNGRVGLFHDNGSQQFGTGQTLMGSVGPPAYGLDIFQYTGTFRFDVVAGGDELWMRSNTGPGFLASPPVLLTSGGGDVSAVAFNRGNSGSLQDARVYVASEGSGELRIWSGFQNATPSLGYTAAYDGITDIVHYVLDSLNPNTWWSLEASHTQHGLLSLTPFYINSKAWGLRSICVSDMDGDAITDLVWCGDEDDDVAWVKRDSTVAGYAEYRMTPLSGGTMPPRFADLDGDGDPDCVLSFLEGRSIGWVENLGGGDYAEPVPITINAYDHRNAIPADLDGDGDMDVLTAYADDTLLYFPNNGSGLFGPAIIISSTVADNYYLAAEDLDGDGDTDILTVDRTVNGVPVDKTLLLNDGAGNFTMSNALAQGPDQFLLLADLDDDGLVDVLDESSSTGVIWYRNLGGGSFAPNAVIAASGTLGGTVRRIFVADADGDGDPDLLVASAAGTAVYWIERTSLGWNPPALLLSEPSENIVSVAMGDFDGDGDADILAGLYDGGRVVWYANTGGLVFGPSTLLTDELIIAWNVDVIDLDGDGLVDAVASSNVGDRVLGFLNDGSIATAVTGRSQPVVQATYDPRTEVIVVTGASLGPGWRAGLQDMAGRWVVSPYVVNGGAVRIATNGLARGTYVVVCGDPDRVAAVRVSLW